MKSRQQSSGKLNFQLPACLCLCAPPVIDHLGADLSFTAVITVKCRAIHHPLQSTPVRFTLDALDLMLHRHVLQGLLWPFSAQPPHILQPYEPNQGTAHCWKGKEQERTTSISDWVNIQIKMKKPREIKG